MKVYKKNKSRRDSRPLHQTVDTQYFGAWSALTASDRIGVYVEGYEDIAFWRNIFDEFTTAERRFEIMTPARADLAKGKKVVLGFAERSGKNLILCVDSDFDYLCPTQSAQAVKMNEAPFVVQTYTYAIENLQCYPPSLQSVAVKATKTDREIFNFEQFFADYSKTIYPVFLWYIWAAKECDPEVFSLSDFRNTVRINYLDLSDNGTQTIQWLGRQVAKRVEFLRRRYPDHIEQVSAFSAYLQAKGVVPQETHFYMQGHTLFDHVVKMVLAAVCEALRGSMLRTLDQSRANVMSQNNQVSYYNNSLVDFDQLLLDNRGYMKSKFYDMICHRIMQIIEN